ncbi:MAG: GNAT family N-acetyltransferase, partial [Deltaproteobacteria bacterium]|nr:GNAT family N-acetyltransferase [Deltaproteobacteria bacterium]
LWERFWPRECFFDLWAVRNCFAESYAHPPEFYIAEENGEIVGMLPLSWIEETERYSFFPGELWQGKTWLEQNKILSFKPAAAKALLEHVSGPMHLRYLLPAYSSGLFPENEKNGFVLDETGYLFIPARYDYSFDRYMGEFSARSRKKLIREMNPLETRGLSYRFDHFPDIEKIFRMNLGSFKEYSFFYDGRFLRSFEALAEWLRAQGMLRITTLLLGEEVLAVDMGAVWNSQYTVFAGGTNPEYPGVAKIINFHHLKRACLEKFALVDFLCGDFGWKDRFHLQPRSLYLIDTSARRAAASNRA